MRPRLKRLPRKALRRASAADSRHALPMQQALERALEEHITPARLVSALVSRKVRGAGGELSDNQLQAIAEEVLFRIHGDLSDASFDMEVDGECPSGLRIEFGPSDADAINEIIESTTLAVVDCAMTEMAPELLRQFKKDAPAGLEPDRQAAAKLREGLQTQWGDALRDLELQIAIAGHAGSVINRWLRNNCDAASSNVVEAVTRTHARACQVGAEISTLLENGYADGAISRWRTLHELAVVATFIQTRGEETATRFLEHADIEEAKVRAFEFKARTSRPATAAEEAAMRTWEVRAAELCEKHGKSFREDYGWASKDLCGPRTKFADLESAVEFDRARSYYKLASQNVHAGALGTFQRLGVIPEDGDLLAIGPTGFGIDVPGRLTVYTLAQVTTALMLVTPSLDGLIWSRVMFNLASEADASFERARARVLRQHQRKSSHSPISARGRHLRRPR